MPLFEPSSGGGISEIFSDVASQALTASSTITATDGEPYTPLTSASNITLTSEPTIAAGRDGQAIFLKNTGSNTITIQDVNALGGSLIRLTANTLTINAGGTMKLIYDSTIGFWIEQYLLNPQTFTPSISGLTIDGVSSASHEVGGTSEPESPSTHDFVLTYVGTPSACSIDISSGEINVGDYPITLSTPFLTATGQPNFYRGTSVGSIRVFTATATVAGVGGLTRTATLSYINRRYCGPNSQSTQLSSAQVLGLDGAGGTSELSTVSTNSTGFSVTTAGGEYIWYAHRSGYTTITFCSINGELCGFSDMSTMTHTNDSNFAETFRQYRTTNTGFGTVTFRTGTSYGASNFRNRIFMGPHTSADLSGEGSPSAAILTLDDTIDGESNLNATVATTYTSIKIETGEYLWFCHPDAIADLATIKDESTGFAIAGSYRTNVTFTNAFGYVETYRCWRSDNTAIFPSGQNVVVT